MEEEIKDVQPVVDELEGDGVALAEAEEDVLQTVDKRDERLGGRGNEENGLCFCSPRF